MPATLVNYDAALKEMWPNNKLEDQLYNGNTVLDKLEKSDEYTVGQQAVVPLKVDRNGGYSAVPAAGSPALNAAGNVGLAQATYQYKYHWQQIKIENAAIANTSGAQAVANVIDTEVEGALDALRKQLTRQVYSNGDALIAQCRAGGASTTVNLELPTNGAYGYDALVRHWLHIGQVVDIGTAAAESSIAADTVISAVNVSPTNPQITIGSSVTTTMAHYVSIANARSGATSFEMNGLQNLVSTTQDFGGLTVAANPTWQAAGVDNTTTSVTLDALLTQNRQIQQVTGKGPDTVATSLKQRDNLYKLAQAQVRFAGDGNLGLGDSSKFELYGMQVLADADCPDKHVYLLTLDDVFVVRDKPPHWISDITGGGRLEWGQNTTAFVSALIYNSNVAAKRRNSHAQLNNLTA